MEWLTWKAAKALWKRAWPLLLLVLFGLAVVAALLIQQHRERAAYKAGEQAERARNQAELQALKAKQSKVTVKVETRYLDRVKVIREKGQTIVREVKVFVPAGSPELPGGWRLLHDAAAGGTLPDPSGLADAAPVPAEIAAETVADNYATCHANALELTELQAWVREQQGVAQ